MWSRRISSSTYLRVPLLIRLSPRFVNLRSAITPTVCNTSAEAFGNLQKLECGTLSQREIESGAIWPTPAPARAPEPLRLAGSVQIRT